MTVKQRILDKVEESFVKAEKFYGRAFSRPRNIIFKTSGTTAGHCNYGKSELMFQLAIAEQQPDAFIADTPAHEVAHWIDKEVNGYSYTRRGRRDIHGHKWKFIMVAVMKQNADRCHSFDTANVKTRRRKRYTYVCTRGHKLNLSSVIHNRMVRGTHTYRCKCGSCISLHVPSKQEQIDALKKQIAELEN